MERNCAPGAELAERFSQTICITVFTESVLTRIIGSEEVEAVEIQRKAGVEAVSIAVRGVLIRIGVEPNTELFRETRNGRKGLHRGEQSTGD